MHSSHGNGPHLYRVAPDLAVEHFHEESLILLASKDKLIRINKAGAALLEFITNTFVNGDFSSNDLTGLIGRNYSVSESEAADRAEIILSEWVRRGIFIPDNDQQATGGNE